MLSVLLWYTDSDYTLGIFWPLCCLVFYDIQILITPLVSFGHCVVCSSMIYRFWLPLGIFWPLCCLFFYDIQILITPLVSFGHCVFCSSMIYRFWLHPWYLLVIVLSVLLWYTDSDYTFGIFWSSVLLWYTDSDYTLGVFRPLCCLFFYDFGIVITPLVSFGHCVVCSLMSYGFWLHPWYLLAIVFFVLLWYTDSDYTLGIFWPSFLLWYTDSDYTLVIFWPLCCLFFYDIQILITPLVSFGHCVVCSSMIYRFWLHPWYLLVIVLYVLLWYTDSDYTFGIFWSSVLLWYTDSDYTIGLFRPLCCLFFYDIQILINPLVSFGHCVVCSSMIYRFWIPPWYLLAIVLSVLLWYIEIWLHPCYLLAILLSVLLWYTDSDYTLGIFWPLCCLVFYAIQILITPLVSFGHCVFCSSMIYRFWLPLGIFWPLCCLFFYDIQILITPLVSFGHCVFCSSMIYRFWLPLGIFWPLCFLFFYDIQILITPWYLLAIVLSVLLWYTDSDYTLGIFWPLCCMFFYDIQILITPLVSFGHCAVCSSMIYRFWLHLWYLLVISSSMIYRFWLHPWCLSAIVVSVLLWFRDCDYPLGIFWPVCCLFSYELWILITPLVSFGHCVFCSSMIYIFWLHPWYLLAIFSSMIYRFWLHPCYLLAIVLSVLLWYTDSDYPLGIIWPLCCVFFYDIPILIIPLVSFDHCVVCSSMIYRFWLHLWYILAIVLSVLLWYTDSDYPLGIFWPLCCLFFYDIKTLITPLVSFRHCVFCSSMIYRFWLPLGIFWPLCCLFLYDIQILITPFVSFGHCAVCSSMIYRFWLHLWYLLVISSSMIYRFWLHPWCLSAIVLSVLLWFRDCDYPLGIFWPLCCLFSYELWILITPLVSFRHCVVWSSMIYRFWLHPWYLLAIFSSMIYRFWLHPCYLLAIVLSILLWYTYSDYPLGII